MEKNIFICILKVIEDFGTDPESESVGQRYGSEDPDPYQNVTDTENCYQACTGIKC